MQSMTFDQALAYLLSLGHETLTIKLGLHNTETLLRGLGNPEKDFPAVQIAGTNGKGSTVAFLDSICRAAGIRTGLFTSPHLISITERIKIAGMQISEDQFARCTLKVKETAEQLVARGELQTRPTFFEHVTAIALLAFGDAKIDLAILETGLGGRLDSTTAAQADVVAITQVALDHEEYLGHSIEEIAAEKAAIIRSGVTGIIAPQDNEAREVIARRCEEVNVKPRLIGALDQPIHRQTEPESLRAQVVDATPDGRFVVTFRNDSAIYQNVTLSLRGRHQVLNAATAIALGEALREKGFRIPHEAIVHGIEHAEHPGRLELWPGSPQTLFDGAHNPAAARALRDYLDRFVTQPITMIFGAMRDKRLSEMASLLFPRAERLILTEIDNPRGASIEELKTVAPPDMEHAKIQEAASISEGLRIAHEISKGDDLILITGSLYLIGEAQQILKTQTRGLADLRRPN